MYFLLLCAIYYFLTGNVDYGSGPFNITFMAGMMNASFDVPIINENLFEGNETFTVTIAPSSLSNRIVKGTGCDVTVTIINDDSKFNTATKDYVFISSVVTACAINFNQSSYDVNENRGPAQIVVVACNILPADYNVIVTTRDGSANGEFEWVNITLFIFIACTF